MPEIRNPNLQSQGPGGGGGGDMRSTMVFWLLLLLVFLGYETFFNKPKPEPPAQNPSQQHAEQPPASPAAAGQAPAAAASAAAQGRAADRNAKTALAIAAASESTTTVENELYKIVLTNRGGEVVHWILKKYSGTDGKPLDLVQPQISAQFGYPLALFTYDRNLTAELKNALYQVTVSGGQAGSDVLAPATVTFHYAANGIDAVKTLDFGSNYVIGIDTQVTQGGVPVRALVEWPAGLGDMEEFLPSSLTRSQIRTSASSQFVWSANGKQDTTAAKKVSGDASYEQPYSYAGIADLYFAAAFLPEQPDQTTVVTLHHSVDLPSNLSDPSSKKSPADVIGVAVGSTTGNTRLRLFAGPKSTEVLASIQAMGPDGKLDGPSLEPLIQFGMWTWIAKPLYYALRFLRNLMGAGAYNWGWAIIVVTLIFTLAMLPTRIMMMKSSLKMARIQPKVDAIKKRYSHLKMNDPKRTEMNQEMMALYKTEGVNMYGSCLPLLVQTPLFFAYYKVLENAIELRQAHWFWLPDLSMPDPTYILPVLIVVTMFLTQYITPSPGMDRSQQRMMAFMMPAIFGFTMLHFASGLALYWATSNILYLVMQLAINRSHWGKEMHAIAARRAAKKAGASPKVIQGRR
ncbi:MAG: membrane protein insertase YidC [Acidobacteriota bacterium]